MNQIPCIDCITLGMCKGLVNSYKSSEYSSYTFSVLAFKCSLIKKYITEECTYPYYDLSGPGSKKSRKAIEATKKIADFLGIELPIRRIE